MTKRNATQRNTTKQNTTLYTTKHNIIQNDTKQHNTTRHTHSPRPSEILKLYELYHVIPFYLTILSCA